ncbi:MAG: hypothetical protein NDI94_05530 [Candidatus Woesearchaeota archaeon]|nr:hypothetical protein [Candidatus Woesearchaeota archaeon]
MGLDLRHYTTRVTAGIIVATGTIIPDATYRTYLTDLVLSPEEVRGGLIWSPSNAGKGDAYVVISLDDLALEYLHQKSNCHDMYVWGPIVNNKKGFKIQGWRKNG